jgi:hypothetical protein
LKYILDFFANKFDLVNFSFVDDAGSLHEDIILSDIEIETNLNCNYGCGIFEFKKLIQC